MTTRGSAANPFGSFWTLFLDGETESLAKVAEKGRTLFARQKKNEGATRS